MHKLTKNLNNFGKISLQFGDKTIQFGYFSINWVDDF